MKLYYSPGTCSLSPHIVLKEAGLAHELVFASTKTHKLRDGTDYYTINPLGYVPLLELDDGRRLTEGAAIVQYIADQAPEKNLAPANGTFERYLLQSRLNLISTEIHKAYSPLFNPATPTEVKAQAVEKLQGRYRHIDGLLAGSDYLLGSQFSVADAYLYTVTRWASAVGFDLAPFAHVRAHKARVESRPKVQEALQAEGLRQ